MLSQHSDLKIQGDFNLVCPLNIGHGTFVQMLLLSLPVSNPGFIRLKSKFSFSYQYSLFLFKFLKLLARQIENVAVLSFHIPLALYLYFCYMVTPSIAGTYLLGFKTFVGCLLLVQIYTELKGRKDHSEHPSLPLTGLLFIRSCLKLNGYA